jgi:hypothetical protein
MLEYWRKQFFVYHSIIPLFHYSILFCLFTLCDLCVLCGKKNYGLPSLRYQPISWGPKKT